MNTFSTTHSKQERVYEEHEGLYILYRLHLIANCGHVKLKCVSNDECTRRQSKIRHQVHIASCFVDLDVNST